jgi:hypothetical protein
MPAGAEESLQRIVDALAARLGRSATIDDPACASSRRVVTSATEDAVRVTSLLSREMPGANRAHVLVPGRRPLDWAREGRRERGVRGEGAGVRPRPPLRPAAGLPVAHRPGRDTRRAGAWRLPSRAPTRQRLLLHGLTLRRGRDRGLDEALLRGLLADDPAARARAEVSLREARRLPHQAQVVVVVVEPTTAAPDGPEATALALGLALDSALAPVDPPSTLHHADGDRLVLLVRHAADGARSAAAVARRVLDAASRSLGPSVRCVAGIGSTADVGGAHASYAQARMATRAARLLPGSGDVVQWDGLGIYAVLLQLLPEDAATPLPDSVAGLLSADPSGRLLETVESYLDHAGDAQACATHLRIHRTTLYYRLRRLEELSAVDLSRGEDRLTVHLGIKLARLAGHLSKAEPEISS